MSLFDLVQHVALVTMLERGEEEEPDAVKMSTLHASKGLEYPHVYRPASRKACCRTWARTTKSATRRAAENLATRIQEERRLMYVGITRAQRSLNLSWCKPPRPRGRGARTVALHRGNGPGRSRHQGRRGHRGDESEGTVGYAQGPAEVDPEAPGALPRGAADRRSRIRAALVFAGRVVCLALGLCWRVGFAARCWADRLSGVFRFLCDRWGFCGAAVACKKLHDARRLRRYTCGLARCHPPISFPP